jgi:hypothetical protein
MARALITFLFVFSAAATHSSPASAQVQPLIVDLAITALRGLTYGAATKGGEALFDNFAKTPDSGTRSPAPSPGPAPSIPNLPPTSGPAPIVVPIEPPTPPDGIHWRIRNDFGSDITMQFYSASRRGMRWPGSGRAYLIASGQPVTIRLRCVPGEKICYGAGVAGRYWGAGLGFRFACANCCRACGSEGRGVALR